jgi:hypothetical protein
LNQRVTDSEFSTNYLNENNVIFVSIASYRDPELIPTIKDCLHKAKYPNDLRFGVCWQHGENEDFPFLNHDQFRTISIPWEKSQGCCWARSQIQSLYNGEDFFLQLDSHHRFVQDWDQVIIDMLEQTGSQKPLLTAYVPAYTIDIDTGIETREEGVWQMNFSEFSKDGIPLFIPGYVTDVSKLNRPFRSRYLSGHFLFSEGKFIEECPYDPGLYFHGEEISMAVRAFTHGYDLYHPNKPSIFHMYIRDGRVKHWDDHSIKSIEVIKETWDRSNHRSIMRVQQLLGLENHNIDLSRYGLGSIRTLAEYEQYAGIDLKNRRIKLSLKAGNEPPSDPFEPFISNDAEKLYKVNCNWDPANIPDGDYEFWALILDDSGGNSIWRKDLTLKDDPQILNREITSYELSITTSATPHKWILWPYSKTQQWVSRLELPVQFDR